MYPYSFFDEIVQNPKIILEIAEAHLEPCKKPMKERFCENNYRLLAVSQKLSIMDV